MENQFPTKNKLTTQSFSSHGKLLLTGEYLVLLGAKGLALATQPKQSLVIKANNKDHFSWMAHDENGDKWIDLKFVIEGSKFKILNVSDAKRIHPLIDLVELIFELKPALFEIPLAFTTHLEFNPSWGLGTSSTLIANLAKWAEVDPYLLLEKSFGGSGYDIEVAMKGENLTFSRNGTIESSSVQFTPPFADKLWFVYLNRKKSSRDAIISFNQNSGSKEPSYGIERVSVITEKILSVKTLEEFEELMLEHETILSEILNEPTVREQHFPDYKFGIVKSLGAWGGDFVLATGTGEEVDYFKRCGYETVIPFKELILT